MTTVAVVGAGPAGLEAAAAALAAGAFVTLLDATDEMGGQYWRHLPQQRSGAAEERLHHGWSTFRQLRDELLGDPHCRWLPDTSVWAIEPGDPPTVHVVTGEPDGAGRERFALRLDALVLATGAHDRTLPFPGWDLPGVFTGGAAQALAKGERIAVGERVVVAGAGPFLLPVASSLLQTGVEVAEVVEAGRARALGAGWLAQPWRLAGSAAKTGELGGYVRDLARRRVPYRTGSAVTAADGTDRVEAVTVSKIDSHWRPVPGTGRRVEVDAVCISHGFTPRLELAVAAGCRLADGFVAVDDDQRTSVPTVFAAGEITGIGGADLARAEGALAGALAAGADPPDPALSRTRRRLGRLRDFAARIEAAHGIQAGWTGWLADDTIVCRCEEVTAGEVRRVAAATDSRSLRSIRLTTRAGLGICQARVCGSTVEALIRERTVLSGFDPTAIDSRPIAVPIRLGELATPPRSGEEYR